MIKFLYADRQAKPKINPNVKLQIPKLKF